MNDPQTTEALMKVVDHLLQGKSISEASRLEQIPEKELRFLMSRDSGFENHLRSRQAEMWKECEQRNMYLVVTLLARLQSIVENGDDRMALRAASHISRMLKVIKPKGYYFGHGL